MEIVSNVKDESKIKVPAKMIEIRIGFQSDRLRTEMLGVLTTEAGEKEIPRVAMILDN